MGGALILIFLANELTMGMMRDKLLGIYPRNNNASFSEFLELGPLLAYALPICNINEAASTSCSLSPVESIDSESSLSPEKQSPRRESSQTDDKKQEIQEARSPTENENEKTIMSNDNIGAKTEAVRPMNLSLPEHEAKPPRLKYIAKIKQAKREGRLLSVPNLKFSKNETTVCDLRCEESATSESFTGNLIRRFSKCLYI